MYAKYIKRVLDILLSLTALLLLSPLLLVLIAVGAVKMKGNPFFCQLRPGKDEKIFRMVKFRSMTNACDSEGNLLPDEKRLTNYGRVLRAKSIDELPELINILCGQMSFVGPRPQLVRDMVFMSAEQRKRHNVRPGLTGLAQVSGRNALWWDKKLQIDLEYISEITFRKDVQIIFQTAKVVLLGGDSAEETDITDDYGDFLLKHGEISQNEYEEKMAAAGELLGV